jgi:NAD+ kinase
MSRQILLVVHGGRIDAVKAAETVVTQFAERGIDVVTSAAAAREDGFDSIAGLTLVEDLAAVLPDCELAVVLGGDGTLLRAAEVVRGSGVARLGVNLGHVGFLAEAEREALSTVVTAVVDRTYEVEERLALDVVVTHADGSTWNTWALNEATVEKVSRAHLIVVLAEVDGRPVSRWGCDGVVMASPTGSTAYAFSAGGPIVWPEVEALCMVPISAHALFARPLVVAPTSELAVQIASEDGGVVWADGRRSCDVLPGARIVVTRSTEPVRLARLHRPPFADRLVAKFALPINGWRGQ